MTVIGESGKTGVGVLDKSVAIIDFVERRPATLSEIAEELGSNSSTVYRLVMALTRHGFLRRGPDGRFYPGRRFSQDNLVAPAAPVFRELRDRTGESIQLWVRRGQYRLSLLNVDSPDPLRVVLEAGSSLPWVKGRRRSFCSDSTTMTSGTLRRREPACGVWVR